MTPFIQLQAAKRLVSGGVPRSLRVLTRFSLMDFAEGVSSSEALRFLLGHGAKIRGIKNLHAKLYVFGVSRAILTSANLTERALKTNHELGIVTDDHSMIQSCTEYFDSLWERAGSDLTDARLSKIEDRVSAFLASGRYLKRRVSLGDEGADLSLPELPPESALQPLAERAFVKFLGEGHRRIPSSSPVLDELLRSGCYAAAAYPKGKRPRRVPDGATIFFGRLVDHPRDIRIFGRATAMKHVPGRDDATVRDRRQYEWRSRWPHYVRVHHGEFVAGNLENGISLEHMMDELRHHAFASTQRNERSGKGNTNPRHSFRQQPDVELSGNGAAWMDRALTKAFGRFGKTSNELLRNEYWPSIPAAWSLK